MPHARKKSRPYEYSKVGEASDRQTSLRQVKVEAEQLREKLQHSILDNPKVAKKAALLVSLWIEGKQRPRKR
jgi:hypothetical protein